MATHYSLKSSSPTCKLAPNTSVNIVLWSDNKPALAAFKPMGVTLSSSMHAIFDAADPEQWDQLWLLRHDIELALEAARPGSICPLPDTIQEESDVEP